MARDRCATEQQSCASGAAFTFLPASAYHEVSHYLLGPDDVIRGPAGSGRVAFVGQDDVADVAFTVVLDATAHAGATYELSGPRALSRYELAELFTRTEGRCVTHVEPPGHVGYVGAFEIDPGRHRRVVRT